MNTQEQLTRYVANFVDELSKSGLTDVVISPGSRSTPLAMMFAEHPQIKEWIVLDERSAAFFGLGLAKQTKRPVALLCSSGTAVANYFPAVVEAHQSRVPLIVLTADRPHELRDVGAPQAIDQIKLFGDYVKNFHEMALPEGTVEMLNYVRTRAARSVSEALSGNPGPIHLNFPFREPLTPDLNLENIWGEPLREPYHIWHEGKKRLPEDFLNYFAEKLSIARRGLIVCGPQVDEELAEGITMLAETLGVPVLADPLSQIRTGSHSTKNIIEGYDAILRNEVIRASIKPDYILRFGAMPVSKAYLFYLKENQDVTQYVIEPHAGFREPVGNPTEFIQADPVLFCSDLLEVSPTLLSEENDWLTKWKSYNDIAKSHLTKTSDNTLTEGEAVKQLVDVIPHNSSLYVGNSMAVRDVDTFLMTSSKKLTILANRGANGIDGMVSSGVGAAASGQPVTLLLGDLSFFHDMNGLLAAKQYKLNITILVVNNNGGGIFSFLPQAANEKHFEALFGTPLNIDFKKAVEMYDGNYHQPKTIHELKKALQLSYGELGLSVVEVKTDRTENLIWHRGLWRDIEEDILKLVEQ
ncbi:2-succinyl-5-enolpyruvyl-6-hydroxy-3-cyclohexene-1-carboxylic-acid synthase [Ornithinibacillus halotolerans]|uniref:2-succinyl-5-enolpyruvyl-6-hydroxy-3-cyclohexene-1-carboxylate synthase n=1 Tax=Ornithinibacillus halotolerans TaxID=1274357 RepID=A0A916RYE3_9BACI|nr:2-succinyl-5-enolpyruvyl-6-hydroxy-3-cyclohexene-1-carboxylic-acid synthase [Ornithinibacillus halotolerans]GGA76460.1 2-succinyl-5-enolpyruvyl-6-hydroxy-3-cyclohexene-1-carboxylate synthase [Ornithinibacillus halotolerans]